MAVGDVNKNRAEFRKQLNLSFSKSELKNISFDLGFDTDDFGQGKSDFSRELIQACLYRGLIPDLIRLCKVKRNNVTWPSANEIIGTNEDKRKNGRQSPAESINKAPFAYLANNGCYISIGIGILILSIIVLLYISL